MTYADDIQTMRSTHLVLADRLGEFVTLEHVLEWMRRERHPLASLDMVTQDEFCHDLLMPIGSDWLVFGMT